MFDQIEGLPFPIPEAWRYQRRVTVRDVQQVNPHWFSPAGTCRWCGELIDRTVEEDRLRRNWHARCSRQAESLFQFHTRSVAKQRDHGVCAICGRDCEALENRRLKLWRKARRMSPQGSEKLVRWLVNVFGWPKQLARGTQSLWEADHIVAVKDGGGLLRDKNIQTLCWRCHQKKTGGRS